jgi:hypothetical protein
MLKSHPEPVVHGDFNLFRSRQRNNPNDHKYTLAQTAIDSSAHRMFSVDGVLLAQRQSAAATFTSSSKARRCNPTHR